LGIINMIYFNLTICLDFIKTECAEGSLFVVKFTRVQTSHVVVREWLMSVNMARNLDVEDEESSTDSFTNMLQDLIKTFIITDLQIYSISSGNLGEFSSV